MTIVKNNKEYEINGVRYFVEKYSDDYHTADLWRYGYIAKWGTVDFFYKLKDGLRSRPNIKRLFGG